MLRNIVVFCTCGSEGEAESIASELVGRKLAACVNITAPVRSVYRWQGKIESAAEWMLVIKTTQEVFPALTAAIHDLHSYEVPEIISLPITAGSPAYLKWIEDSTNA
jgi:periplasmic divalent cation tolerance protein